MEPTYDIGDRVTLSATFTEDGAAVDPDTVTCYVKHEDAASRTTVSSSKVGTGSYEAQVDPSTPGRWYYRFEGTGEYMAAAEGSFIVSRPRVLA